MFNISNNGIITITRGDYFSLPLFMNQGTELKPLRYILDDKSQVYVGVMEANQPFETALIRKKFTSADLNDKGDINIEFFPEDTQCLLPGKYYYQIKLNKYNAEKDKYEVHTVVQKTQFFIEE